MPPRGGGRPRAESARSRTGLEIDLRFGEAELGQPGDRVRLVALPVSRLLGRRAVVAQRRRSRRPGRGRASRSRPRTRSAAGRVCGTGSPARRRAQEAPLQLGVGEAEELASSSARSRATPRRAAVVVRERLEQRHRIDQIEPVGLVDRPLEPLGRPGRRPGRSASGSASSPESRPCTGDIHVPQPAPPMQPHPRHFPVRTCAH